VSNVVVFFSSPVPLSLACHSPLLTNVSRRTILASSGADGRVRLWKASYSSIWRPMGYVTAEEAETPVPGAGGVAGRESDEEGGQED